MLLNCLISLSCLLAAAQVRSSQDVAMPPRIEKFLQQCESSRRGVILQIEHQLRGLHGKSPARRDTSRRIADLEKQLRELRSGARPVVPQLSFPPRVGAIGRLPRLFCHVDQVVSDDELLARCFFPVVVTTVRRFRARNEKVVQPVRLLIRGLSTKDIDEGSDVEMLQVFEIVGRERYRTEGGGSSNLLVLKPFDLKSIEPYIRQATGQGG